MFTRDIAADIDADDASTLAYEPHRLTRSAIIAVGRMAAIGVFALYEREGGFGGLPVFERKDDSVTASNDVDLGAQGVHHDGRNFKPATLSFWEGSVDLPHDVGHRLDDAEAEGLVRVDDQAED